MEAQNNEHGEVSQPLSALEKALVQAGILGLGGVVLVSLAAPVILGIAIVALFFPDDLVVSGFWSLCLAAVVALAVSAVLDVTVGSVRFLLLGGGRTSLLVSSLVTLIVSTLAFGAALELTPGVDVLSTRPALVLGLLSLSADLLVEWSSRRDGSERRPATRPV